MSARLRLTAGSCAAVVCLTTLGATPAFAQTPGSREANGGAGMPSITADGARVAFDSDATNLVREDTNRETTDPFVRDLVRGSIIVGDRTRRRRHARTGGRFRRSPGYAISANGLYIVFSSNSRDLGRGGGGHTAIWRRNLATGRLDLVTRVDADEDSESPAISADGQVVVFESRASNMAGPGDSNRHTDIYWRHMGTGEMRRISVPLRGRDRPALAGNALNPVVSADGTWVAYTYDSTNLVEGRGATAGIYRTNAATGTTEAVDVAPPPPVSAPPPAPLLGSPAQPAPAQQSPAQGGGEHPSLSGDGNLVMFDSDATDLPGGAANGAAVDVFVKDMSSGTVRIVSRSADDAPAAGDSAAGQITPDGRVAVFTSSAPLAGVPDQNGFSDVYARDIPTGALALVSEAADGGAGDAPSIGPSVSADGRYVAFLSRAPKISGQPAGPYRVIRRDLLQPAGFAVVNTGMDARPRTLIASPGAGSTIKRGRLRSIEGTAADDFLVKRVQIAVARRSGSRCAFLRRGGRRFSARRRCSRPVWIRTRLQSNLRFTLRAARLPRGRYMIRTRAFDDRGQVERRTRKRRNVVSFSLR